MYRKVKLALEISAVALLSACGGGSGSGVSGGGRTGPVASSLTFNASTAMRSLAVSGQTANFSVSSSDGCTGSGSFTAGATTTSNTFENQSALSSTSMFNIQLHKLYSCNNFKHNNKLHGHKLRTTWCFRRKYIVYAGGFNVPSTARVGEVGIIGNALRYTSSSKTIQDGTAQLSYVVEADTESTALITVSTKTYSI